MCVTNWDNAVGTEKHLLCALRSPRCTAGGTGRALGSGTGCPPASLCACLDLPFMKAFPLCAVKVLKA